VTVTKVIPEKIPVIGSTNTSEKCCICGDVADGYHYGALSCRGCNAFFRRAVTCKLNFTCRRGGHCPVDKDVRCSCRACRLKKCEEMGMDRRGTFFTQNTDELLSITVGEILAAEQAVLREPATGRDYSLIFEVQMNLMFQWVNSLPEYKAIDDNDDKVKLLRAFAFRYLLLDNIFHSVELNVRDRIVLVNNSYIIPGQIPAFYPGEDPNARMVKLMCVNHLLSSFTSMEMMALRLFIFWNPSVNNLSSSTNIIVQTAADNAMGELHQWYSNNGILNVEERVSSILLLLPVLIVSPQVV
uniref:Nuclear receptor domain-containing protein n=1 Tax=Syphacia muris TaxID=451379 RepID=A0A0N5AZ02_9BILA